MEISSFITVIPRLSEERMVRGVSSYQFSLNLSIPSSGGTTAEAMEDCLCVTDHQSMEYVPIMRWLNFNLRQ